MKFTVSSSALQSLLATTGKVISNKSSLPILEYFLMELKDGQLTVTTSNDTESYACVFLARSQVTAMEDEYELMNFIINNFIFVVFSNFFSFSFIVILLSFYRCVKFNFHPLTNVRNKIIIGLKRSINT